MVTKGGNAHKIPAFCPKMAKPWLRKIHRTLQTFLQVNVLTWQVFARFLQDLHQLARLELSCKICLKTFYGIGIEKLCTSGKLGTFIGKISVITHAILRFMNLGRKHEYLKLTLTKLKKPHFFPRKNP